MNDDCVSMEQLGMIEQRSANRPGEGMGRVGEDSNAWSEIEWSDVVDEQREEEVNKDMENRNDCGRWWIRASLAKGRKDFHSICSKGCVGNSPLFLL